MFLIIPAIDLLGQYCVRSEQGSLIREPAYFDDPVKMARLWRVQNARALHVQGHDEGDRCRLNVLESVCRAVDIPVQLRAGFGSLDEVAAAFETGVYRVVLDLAAGTRSDLFSRSLERFGPSRIIAGVRASMGRLYADRENSATEFCRELENAGCRRIVYDDRDEDGRSGAENVDAVRKLAGALDKCRITIGAGIDGYEKLLEFSSMSAIGVDSAVIGRALYENRFSCQQFWCWNDKDRVDLDRFSTARLSGDPQGN